MLYSFFKTLFVNRWRFSAFSANFLLQPLSIQNGFHEVVEIWVLGIGKSQEANSSKYCAWGMIFVEFLAKKLRNSIDVRWCIIVMQNPVSCLSTNPAIFKHFSIKNFVGNTKFEANSLFLIFCKNHRKPININSCRKQINWYTALKLRIKVEYNCANLETKRILDFNSIALFK